MAQFCVHSGGASIRGEFLQRILQENSEGLVPPGIMGAQLRAPLKPLRTAQHCGSEGFSAVPRLCREERASQTAAGQSSSPASQEMPRNKCAKSFKTFRNENKRIILRLITEKFPIAGNIEHYHYTSVIEY